jgi:hypothetical protein
VGSLFDRSHSFTFGAVVGYGGGKAAPLRIKPT